MHVKTTHLSERYSPLIKRELGVISRRRSEGSQLDSWTVGSWTVGSRREATS